MNLLRSLSRPRRWLAFVPLCAIASVAAAQDAGTPRGAAPTNLRIVRYTPSDSGTPNSIIAITFDRPVAVIREQSADPRQVMTIAPEVPGEFEWRDATTLRFLPHEPIKPGTTMSVVLDTAAIASGGTRRGPRVELALRFAGARPLAMMVGEHLANTDWAAGPFPVFRVLYSTIVDLDSVATRTRLVFPDGCGGTIKLKPLRQRTVQKGEGNPIERAGGMNRDTIPDRYRRVVEFEPTDSLPPNCLGLWHVASFDPSRPLEAWRYGVRTAPPFVVTSLLPCLLASYNKSSDCESDGLSLVFSADVSTEEFVRHVHFSPDLPRIATNVAAKTVFLIPDKLAPRKTYTVTIDDGLRDTFGRALSGPSTFTVMTHEKKPDLQR
ncbi:MAG: Ig-like domain-containing protein [Gemmatimonadaceae bacterium]